MEIYGLALCFLTLFFFSSVKLAAYHSADQDFASAKVWQQESLGSKSIQVADQQQVVVAFVALLVLLVAPIATSGRVSQGNRAASVPAQLWFCPCLFLRPPPVA